MRPLAQTGLMDVIVKIYSRMRFPRTTALLSLFLLAACSALPTPVVLDQGTFDGMSALVGDKPPARPLHILMVHGIGTTTPDQFESFIAALANRLRLVQILSPSSELRHPDCREATAASLALVRPDPTPINITGVPANAQALLYNYAFASAANDSCAPAPVLKISFLLWAPLTLDRRDQIDRACRGWRTAKAGVRLPRKGRFHRPLSRRRRSVWRDLPRQRHASVCSGGPLPCDWREAKPERQDLPARRLQ